ncbi:MAG: AAA family ATPase [Xanthobacteraceae bacterium]
MQQIADWLEKLGMSEYAKRFAENDIDISVLRDLTDQDLKELDVSLGHRRKMLRAIAEFAGAAPTSPQPALTEPKPHDTAERRQVTVMFSDLVGSTALSARMDPEDLREVISAYQKCVAETVQRFGGFVAKYMGDGVLIYFGYPQAHEDDADRAVRAGLEVIAAVSALKSPVPLQTRVGIATGMVVVGDLIGSGEAQERGIVGETPNLAARLQGIAEPNMVVIADGTRQLIGDLFELQYLGSKDLKGIAGPVRGWAALRPGSAEGRFEALHGSGLTALVGREEELDLLLRRWSKAKTGEGQVVLLSGEAGIGKSRLTAALLERLAPEPHTRLRYFCSPQHTDSAFFPIISQMERAAQLAHEDTAQGKLDKLDTLLALSFTARKDAALISEMLSLPNDGRYPKLELDPQQQRQKTLEALTAQIEALSRSNPVLMIFEDVHWVDPTSLEVLGRTVDRLRTLGVLLIITYRPEFEPPWIGRSSVAALNLNRLGERETVALIDHVRGNKSLPESIRLDIIERTDGIPLFVEEMTKAILEAETEGDARKAASSVPSSAPAVPASLHASLMARLDRLGSAKDLAQTGAAIGREFSHALLAAVADKPEAELKLALDRLEGAGLLFRQGVPPHASYLFKHALVQDAAYGTLLREPRRALHARIAEALETQFHEIAENQPELLARHCTEAGLVSKAAKLWGKAGLRSLERSALVEAVEQLSSALDQIEPLSAEPASRQERLKLQVAIIAPLIHVRGYASEETTGAVERAHRLIEEAENLGDPPEDPLLLFSVLYASVIAHQIAFDGEAFRESAVQFLALAESRKAAIPIMVGHRLIANSLLLTGSAVKGRVHFDQAIARYNPLEHRGLVTRFGQDSRVSGLAFRSIALWMLGYPKAALTDADNAISDAHEIGQAATLMFALQVTFIALMLCGEYAAANNNLNTLVALANEKDTLYWKAEGLLDKGCILALTGRHSEAIDTITSWIAPFRSTGATWNIPTYLLFLASAHAELGNISNAHSCIGDAFTAITATGETWFEAEAHRMAGEIEAKSGKPESAKIEAYFASALAIARQQQAKSWELRAAMSMARLWRDQGKLQQARELLAPVYGWFTEGFDTLDLKEAKALLDTLVRR